MEERWGDRGEAEKSEGERQRELERWTGEKRKEQKRQTKRTITNPGS